MQIIRPNNANEFRKYAASSTPKHNNYAHLLYVVIFNYYESTLLMDLPLSGIPCETARQATTKAITYGTIRTRCLAMFDAANCQYAARQYVFDLCLTLLCLTCRFLRASFTLFVQLFTTRRWRFSCPLTSIGDTRRKHTKTYANSPDR